MYLATSPACGPAGADTGDFPLPLARVVTRAFEGGLPYDREMLRFFADLARLYGLPHQAGQMAGRKRITFTDMVTGMLDELAGDGEPAGLVVLAHAAPDGEPNWPACFLTASLPGEPLAFAVADQGVTAPFTALRIAASYIRADRLRRAILIMLDQSTVLADPGAAAGTPVPAENRAAVLIFDERGTIGEAMVGVTAGVTPAGLGQAMGETVTAADEWPPVIVAGAGLAAQGALRTLSRARVETVPAGLPCTGIWAALAGDLEGWRSGGVRRILLADYDAPTRCLGQCVLRLPAREA